MKRNHSENGIDSMVPREKMCQGASKLRDFYELKANAPVFQCEFGYYSLDRWKREGYIGDDTDLDALFGFDQPGGYGLWDIGWCEAEFSPAFAEKLIEDRGEYEVVQDRSGRHVFLKSKIFCSSKCHTEIGRASCRERV